jgi:glycosyltransferase involved in cell wall biosynthesis
MTTALAARDAHRPAGVAAHTLLSQAGTHPKIDPKTLRAVCHVITGLGRGGAEAMLEKLLRQALKQDPGVAQYVVSLSDEGVIGPRLRAAAVPVQALNLGGLFGLPSAVRFLRNLFSGLPPGSVVQTWMYHADLLGAMACRGLRSPPPLVWNLRQTGLDRADIGRTTLAVVRLCGWLSRRAPKRIVANSHAAIAPHVAFGYDSTRFAVLPNGFDLHAFFPDADARVRQRAAWGMGPDDRLVGLVARRDPQKDHRTFIAAAALVAAKRPDVRFVLVGAGVDTDPELTRWIGERALSARCLRQPASDDVAAVMNALDVVCLSSRAEGFPNVLGEAMACGTPVVSTAAGDAPLIVDDPARIAPTGSPHALAEALLGVLALTDDERRALGLRDRARVAAEYDIGEVWLRYRTLYEQVLREAHSGV